MKLLRQAYAKAVKDPELLAEAQKKSQWELDPVTGEDLQELARRVVEQPPAVIEQIKRILRSN